MGILFYIMKKLGVKSSKINAELGLSFVLSIVCAHYYFCTIKYVPLWYLCTIKYIPTTDALCY